MWMKWRRKQSSLYSDEDEMEERESVGDDYTLLLKDKDFSTERFVYKSVPDDVLNTPYKSERERGS